MDKSMNKITVAVAEDETPIRQLLQSYLETFPQIEITAVVSNGNELIKVIKEHKVTAVFLDIEMPGLDGLSTAARIKRHQPDVFVVFVTAHPHYAVDAFQLKAVDYLIKPITREAIAGTIKTLEKFLQLNIPGYSNEIQKRISIKNNHELYFVNPFEIIFIEKELRKTVLHTTRGKYLSTEPLNALENNLSENFFRCHKGFIINLDRIEKIIPVADRMYEVSFYEYSGKVTMRRKKYEELCKIMISQNNCL
ncbi:LytR/AlgR family response regulator transcription factor [Candidatus Contubernalis alkaliaceticus]|uniref:LytR/AlgR family response regulator transcription factor n=1 Tax=Candidatus Contubernalis alkaliaceticus TaxID=338645 RepID=UPI001F4BD845|nr:LytTR family DNA-binding domain-containing protein [Candidatus Contubernalis alkalaceticus]UNC91089.1 response regulator transcription factor [Candidatus Contubernalis alkalaceticus]